MVDFDVYEHYRSEFTCRRIRRCYEYFKTRDTRFVAHRSLLKDRVPDWMSAGKELPLELGSFAYGDTPAPVVARFLSRIGAAPEERFLDLGCGCGSACLAAATRMVFARGVDLLPAVVGFAHEASRQLGIGNVAFEVADVREFDPTQAEVIYLAWTSFTPEVRESVGRHLERTAGQTRVVTVTHPLPVQGFEPLGSEDYWFSWNDEEPVGPHTFFFHRRV